MSQQPEQNQVDGRLVDKIVTGLRTDLEQALYSNRLLSVQYEVLQQDFEALKAEVEASKNQNQAAPQEPIEGNVV